MISPNSTRQGLFLVPKSGYFGGLGLGLISELTETQMQA